MAALLYRIGAFAARRARLVITAWLVLLAVTGLAYLVGGVKLATGFDIPGTPTGTVTQRLAEEIPAAAGGSAVVVVATSDGAPFTAQHQAAIADTIAQVQDIRAVAAVLDPFVTEQERAHLAQELAAAAEHPEAMTEELALQLRLLEPAAGIRLISEDASVALVNVTFIQTTFDVSDAVKHQVMDTFSTIEGLEISFGASLASEVPEMVGVGEIIGVVIAAIVLLIMLGTLVGAGLPLISALVGVSIGALGALSLSNVVDMVSVTPALGVMLGLAVGIDYSLFIINRHRTQLKRGASVPESIALANGTSGNAVVFAGSTVVIALLGLNLTGIPFLGLMGTVGAVSVIIAVAIAVTLTPAMLSVAGPRIISRRERTVMDQGHRFPPKPARVRSTKVALASVALGVAALATVAIPGDSMRLGLPDGAMESPESTQYVAYTTVADNFGEGANATLVAVADLPAPASSLDALASQAEVVEYLAGLDHVAAVAPIGTNDTGTVAAFQIIPTDGPSAPSTEQLVDTIRTGDDAPRGVSVAVAGSTSAAIDISDALADALPLYLAVVIGVSLLIMVLVFRSLWVPVIATGGFILSIFAAFGAVVAIYQWGWLAPVFGVHAPGPILSFLPTILVGVLFGLAMDYMLFVGTGMREAYAHGVPARQAVSAGLNAGRSVVTAAAVIMASVFGGFVFADSAMIRPIGFGLAFGVLVDAFVVRMWVVPAVMHLLGERAWWLPGWLDRILPHVDVEGASLEREGAPALTPSSLDPR